MIFLIPTKTKAPEPPIQQEKNFEIASLKRSASNPKGPFSILISESCGASHAVVNIRDDDDDNDNDNGASEMETRMIKRQALV